MGFRVSSGFLCRRDRAADPQERSDVASGPCPALTASRRAPPGILNARPLFPALPRGHRSRGHRVKLRLVKLMMFTAPSPPLLRPSVVRWRRPRRDPSSLGPASSSLSPLVIFRDSGAPQGASPACAPLRAPPVHRRVSSSLRTAFGTWPPGSDVGHSSSFVMLPASHRRIR